MEEVDNRVLNIRKQLFEKVTKMPQSVEQQKKLIKALISLESQQIATSVGDKLRLTDPAWSAIDARAKYLESAFKQTFDQYTTKDGNQESKKIYIHYLLVCSVSPGFTLCRFIQKFYTIFDIF